MSRLKRLVCVVEGKGEVQAMPALCTRILAYLGVEGWFVDPDPVRAPRSLLVDEKVVSPHRPPHPALEARIELAYRRPADAVVVVCDADDDCAASWGPAAAAQVRRRIVGAAVMAVREYEAWLLASYVGPSIRKRSVEQVRDAKGEMRKVWPDYTPTVHQKQATSGLDVERARAGSDSFDKLVRDVATVLGVTPPARPALAGLSAGAEVAQGTAGKSKKRRA